MSVKQAAILCGGLGTRLRPLTDTVSKAMVPVNGKPYLVYILEQLRGMGIKEAVLMTGYRGEQIREQLGDGSDLGIRLKYSHGPVEWETGRRILEARPLLQSNFLLLYCDNYANFSLRKAEKLFETQKPVLCLTLFSKPKGNNIRLSEDGRVLAYDKGRTQPNLNFVELGYILATDKVFDYFPHPDCSFSDVIAKIVNEGKAAGQIVHTDYLSVSDLDRLKIAEEYLKPKKILLIDRDGVINHKAPRGEYITHWEDFRFIDGTVAGLQQIAARDYEFIVISNQAGIARGALTQTELDALNARMITELGAKGIRILKVYTCPHHWDEKCFCRKPNPGMFVQASKDFKLFLAHTRYVGDDPRDCLAAYNAGCPSVYLGSPQDLDEIPREAMPLHASEQFSNLIPYLGVS